MAGVGATSNAIPRRLQAAIRMHAGEHVTLLLCNAGAYYMHIATNQPAHRVYGVE
jgi:hypothetical protein